MAFGQERATLTAQSLQMPWQARRAASGAAACATGPDSPCVLGKSNSSDAQSQQERARQFSQPTEPVHCSWKSSVPAGWLLAAQLKAKFSPSSVPFAAHNSCWRPGQQDACEKGQEPINQHWTLAALAESALLSATFLRKLKYYGTSDRSPFPLQT